ncbi:glycoside hydrolase family protein [uncultured Mediterranea sp.]|uniref:glycoside hydrolase family protein n=1 Tax=uncultured Mediterranea sp. TaxID=1926662 RepID=UPI0027D969BA|nr:glycoside hydrolase family protein [uncultured Mediterranea sp.]
MTNTLKLAVPLFCLSLFFAGMPPKTYGSGEVDLRIEKRGDSRVAVGFSAFSLDSHFVWCGSAIRAVEDGKYYLFYSAMGAGDEYPPFADAWVLGSKIGIAVSDSPYGGYKDLGICYNKDGYRPDSSSWDAQTVHNPHIQHFGGKYYLYYIGARDPGASARVKGKVNRRDRIQQSLTVGVMCFNTIQDFLEGKVACNERPLLLPRTRVKPDNVLEPSPEGTAMKPDNLIMVNPSVVYRPSDKKYLLYFKGNVYDPHWRGIHGVALADNPEGPFTVLDDYVFDFETEDGRKLNAEDPFVWYHHKDSYFYAVFKDFTGSFTKGKPGLAIMESKDGIHWKLPENSLFMDKKIKLKNGGWIDVDRLERPQLLLDENDEPIVLYAACAITPVNSKKDGSSFNIQIPIVQVTEQTRCIN